MKEKLIEAGGKLWEPNERISRIYLNDEAISKAFGWKLVEKAKYLEQFESIGKAKVWYDCKKNTFHSDCGQVRVLFCRHQIDMFK